MKQSPSAPADCPQASKLGELMSLDAETDIAEVLTQLGMAASSGVQV
jgi:hypothetical protein